MPMLVKLPHNPRRPGGADSMPNSAAPPHSPPAAKPWIRRSSTSSTGAAAPMLAWLGRQPIRKVLNPINSSVVTSTFCRPTRSPKWPNTRPPKGRAKNPAPKALNATNVAVR